MKAVGDRDADSYDRSAAIGPKAASADAHALWESVGREWTSARQDRLWRRHADAVNARRLALWLPAGAAAMLKTDLFDEAVGTGQHGLMRARSERVVGIDLSPSIAAAAGGKRDDLHVLVADVRGLPFDAARFDTVISLSTLDHFAERTDIERALRELHRVLRPGGTFVLTLDNPVNPIIALRAVLPRALLRRLGLVPYFCGPSLGPRALRTALERTGFEVLERSAVMHCPRVLAVPLAGWLERRGSRTARERFLRTLLVFERLERTPLRYVSGHFVAALARRV